MHALHVRSKGKVDCNWPELLPVNRCGWFAVPILRFVVSRHVDTTKQFRQHGMVVCHAEAVLTGTAHASGTMVL